MQRKLLLAVLAAILFGAAICVGIRVKSAFKPLDESDTSSASQPANSPSQPVDQIVERLDDSDSKVRNAAVEAAGHAGPAGAPAVPQLASLLESGDRKVEWKAAVALSRIGPASEPAVPALGRLLEAR